MNDKTLKTLEYNKIRDMLAGQCVSVGGRELAENMRPDTDAEQVVKLLEQTAQALHISRRYVSRLEKRALEYLRGRWPAE